MESVTFCWDLWYACNYRCSYCWWELDGLWDSLAKQNRILPPEKWISIWNRIHSLYGQTHISIIGGEPLLYPRCEELLAGLIERHRLSVTTNLSLPDEGLRKMLGRLDPSRIEFGASFHPQYANFEEFSRKVAFIKEKGFPIAVLFVVWPPYLNQAGSWRSEFLTRGIPFKVLVFQGSWNGKKYPESFTNEEKNRLATLMEDSPLKQPEIKYRLRRKSTWGKLCHSGKIYATIKGDGTVYRCSQDASAGRPIGNICDPQFKLYGLPEPCPYTECNCDEFKYLDELRQEKMPLPN